MSPAPITSRHIHDDRDNGDQQNYRENAYCNRDRYLGRQGMSLLFGERYSLVTNLVRETRKATRKARSDPWICCNSIAKERIWSRLDRSANALSASPNLLPP